MQRKKTKIILDHFKSIFWLFSLIHMHKCFRFILFLSLFCRLLVLLVLSLQNQTSILHHFTLGLGRRRRFVEYFWMRIHIFPYFLHRSRWVWKRAPLVWVNSFFFHCLFVRFLFRISYFLHLLLLSRRVESEMKSTRSKEQEPLPGPVNKVNLKWVLFVLLSFRSFILIHYTACFMSFAHST